MPLQFDPYSHEFRADPYPFYARLREEAPVSWNEQYQFWVVSKYDDNLAIIKDHGTFSSTIGPSGGFDGPENALPLVSHDPPDHTRMRRLVNRAFTPSRVAAMEPRIREIASELVDKMLRRRTKGELLDFVEDFSSPLPVIVIGEILGVPREMHDKLFVWAKFTSAGAVGPEADRARRKTMLEEMAGYFEQLAGERRLKPETDLVSGLIQAADEEHQRLTAQEVVRLCILLWAAGNETTTNMMTNGMLALQSWPDERRKVLQDPTLIESLVEEALRYESPVSGSFRRAVRDVELGGALIRQGQAVWPLFASANRDADQFPDADSFEVARQPNHHLAFGQATHFCLGAPLARLEGKVAFETVLARIPELRLHPERGLRIPSPLLRGFARLPMSLRASNKTRL